MKSSKNELNLITFIWGVVKKTDNLSKFILLISGCAFMGVLSYHNMLLWGHYNHLLTGSSLTDATKFCQLLTMHLFVYTLIENIVYQCLNRLAISLANSFNISLHKKVKPSSILSLSLHKDTYAQTITEDTKGFFSQFFAMLARLVYGIVVVIGNILYLAKHKALDILYACLSIHASITMINTMLSQGWSKKSPSQIKSLNGLKETSSKLRVQADRLIKENSKLSCSPESCSWEVKHLETLENERFKKDKSYTSISCIIDVITKIYNRVQAPLLMGLFLYIKKPKFPLPSIITVGQLLQSIQACTQIRFHLGYFYAETQNVSKMRAAYQEIAKTIKSLRWTEDDLPLNNKLNHKQVVLILFRQIGMVMYTHRINIYKLSQKHISV